MAPPTDNDHGCAWRDYANELSVEVAELKAKYEALERAVFGKKSEKLKKMPPVPKPPAPPETVEATRKERAAAREAAMDTITETAHVPESDKVCSLCGGTDFRPVGEGKTSDVFEFVAAHFRRRRLVRETLACRCGGCVITAPALSRWSDKTRYASSFVAHLAVSKCRASMPFYRLEGLASCSGVPMARSTMNELFHRAGAKLCRFEAPLFDAVGEGDDLRKSDCAYSTAEICMKESV